MSKIYSSGQTDKPICRECKWYFLGNGLSECTRAQPRADLITGYTYTNTKDCYLERGYPTWLGRVLNKCSKSGIYFKEN